MSARGACARPRASAWHQPALQRVNDIGPRQVQRGDVSAGYDRFTDRVCGTVLFAPALGPTNAQCVWPLAVRASRGVSAKEVGSASRSSTTGETVGTSGAAPRAPFGAAAGL